MKSKIKKLDSKFILKAMLCIGVGTGAGLVVYGLFLYFNIAIFGWNLGLIFAPLAAGYVETVLANRIIGENIGAISAFILFIDTTFYSFILKNPTLGFNFITAGSIIVILQAAFPTLVNYILLIIVGGIISIFITTIKTIGKTAKNIIKTQNIISWEGQRRPVDYENFVFDEQESNQKINSLDFYFLTSSDMADKKHEILGIYHSEVIIEKDDDLTYVEYELAEKKRLINLKNGKDECLIKLANNIKDNGGNGVLDLEIQYGLIGLGGDNFQISARGMGIKLI